MNYEALSLYLAVANMICTAVVAFFLWLGSRNRVTHKRITELEREMYEMLGNHGTRLVAVETQIKHLPENDDITQVREMVGRVGGDVKGLSAEIKGLRELLQSMQHPVQTITEFLINQGKP